MKDEFKIIQARPRITFHLTRDSVCMGDDCEAPHERQVETPSFTDPVQLAQELAAGYLASVKGSGHTWDCVLNGTVIAVVSPNGSAKAVGEVNYADSNCVHFIYHSATY